MISIGSILFPPRCAVCGTLGSSAAAGSTASPCGRCRGGLRDAGTVPAIVGLDRVIALYRYAGSARPLLAGLKYRNNRACVTWLAEQLAQAWVEQALEGTLTWAPTSPGRARQRGFDQSEVLARALRQRRRAAGHAQGLEALLRRVPGPAQTGRMGRERAQQVHFVARRAVGPGPIVVLDDVLTTGSTLAAAAFALRAAGAVRVEGLVVAYTPPPGSNA